MADDKSIPEGLISQTESFDSKTPISKLIPAIQQYDAVIVNKNGSYLGIIDSRTIYKQMQDLRVSTAQVAEKYVTRVPRVSDTTSIDDVAYYFNKARSKALPYAKNDVVKGILKRSTMLKILLSLGRLSGITAEEAMTSPLIAIDITANVSQAKAAMRANKMNRVAVMDGEKFVGIVTNYDLISRFLKHPERLPEMKTYMYNPANVTLESVVERNPHTLDVQRGLSDAARELIEDNISSVIVTKGSKPVGILTELDIITSAVARSSKEVNKVFVSGLDADTYQFEDEIRETLVSFIAKAEKLSDTKVDYISLVVKKFKTKSYELHARLSLGRHGIINAHVEGHIFERTFTELLDILKHDVKRRKEKYLTVRKVLHNAHASEEES